MATVSFNNTNSMAQASAASLSSSFSVTAGGTNTVAFAIVGFDNASNLSVTSITYGGNAMNSCGAASVENGGVGYVQVFYLAAPPTGSNTLAISITGAREIYANLVSFNNVHQTTPVRPGTYQNTSQATGTGHTITITSATTDLTLSAIMNDGGTGTVGSSNQTDDGTNSNGNFSCGSNHCTTAAASITNTWTFSATGAAPYVGFSIQPPGAGSVIYMLGHT